MVVVGGGWYSLTNLGQCCILRIVDGAVRGLGRGVEVHALEVGRLKLERVTVVEGAALLLGFKAWLHPETRRR